MNSILQGILTCFPESSTFRQGKTRKGGALLAAEESARETAELRAKGIHESAMQGRNVKNKNTHQIETSRPTNTRSNELGRISVKLT